VKIGRLKGQKEDEIWLEVVRTMVKIGRLKGQKEDKGRKIFDEAG